MKTRSNFNNWLQLSSTVFLFLVWNGIGQVLKVSATDDVTFQRPFNLPQTQIQPQATVRALSAVPSDEFIEISHPAFPHHSATIKRSTNFCDDTVKYVD